MLWNLPRLLSTELSKEIPMIFAIIYILFLLFIFLRWIFTWKLNFFFTHAHHFHIFQYFLILSDISLVNLMQIKNNFLIFGYSIPWKFLSRKLLSHVSFQKTCYCIAILFSRIIIFIHFAHFFRIIIFIGFIGYKIQVTNRYKNIFCIMYRFLITISQSKV